MSKTILLIDDDRLNSESQQKTADLIRGLAESEIVLNEDGTWAIKECIGAHGPVGGVVRVPPTNTPSNPIEGQIWIEKNSNKGITHRWVFTDKGWILQDNGLDYIYRNTAADFLDIMSYLSEKLGIPLEDPRVPSPQCTCITECDCMDPANGFKSNACPEHNDQPDPNPDCPQHGHRIMA